MTVLSTISIIIYTSFFIGALKIVTAERKSVLNISAFAVLLCLCFWSFCNAFFFAATTPEQAFFWHKISAIGWCGFVPLTVYYFFALTNDHKKVIVWWQQVLFFIPPMLLIIRNLFGKTTSLAQGIIKSTSGLGWTYENSITSFWLWVYLLYVAVYFGFAFYLLYKWSKSVRHNMKREIALGFILLDLVTILFGVVTDVIMPLTTPFLPALASIGTAIFGIFYFTLLYRHDLFNINLVISSDTILQISTNLFFVIDENNEILKYNNAVSHLLGYTKTELIGHDFMALSEKPIPFESLYSGEELLNHNVQVRCKDGTIKDVLLSASVAQDKYHRFLCLIISCQDVSKQKKFQDELALEREKYKTLAHDYQQLAYYDPLTNLPNRRHFFDVLNDFEALYQTKQQDFAVIFLDLDNFKHANDVYGHGGGDELLKTAADKLKTCMAENEFVARLGGDEFIFLIPNTTPDGIHHKMDQINAAFQKPFLFNGHPYTMGISAGYSVFSEIKDTTKLMHQADEAMYQNKKGIFGKPL